MYGIVVNPSTPPSPMLCCNVDVPCSSNAVTIRIAREKTTCSPYVLQSFCDIC